MVSVHMLIFVRQTGECEIPRTLTIYFQSKTGTNKRGNIKSYLADIVLGDQIVAYIL